MEYRIRNKRKIDRTKIAIVKELLKQYAWSLKVREEIKEEIRNNREKLDMLRAGWSDSDPVNGGGSSQEDKICTILDENSSLECVIEDIKKDHRPIRLAIKSLEDSMLVNIVLRLWVYRDESCRSLAYKYKTSKNTIWRKSDVALLSMWKFLVNYD